jgi:hypothetical protein
MFSSSAAVLTHLPLANFLTFLWQIRPSIIRLAMYVLHDIVGSKLQMRNTPDQVSSKQSSNYSRNKLKA